MIELLLPCGFDTLEYSWVKATIGICTLADYSMAKKCQHPKSQLEEQPKRSEDELQAACGQDFHRGMGVLSWSHDRSPNRRHERLGIHLGILLWVVTRS
jgi:hypothetical protein